MGKLFKYLRQHAGVVLAIIVVLFVQAFCDLSLPTYTSDIVNVGISGGNEKGSEYRRIFLCAERFRGRGRGEVRRTL